MTLRRVRDRWSKGSGRGAGCGRGSAHIQSVRPGSLADAPRVTRVTTREPAQTRSLKEVAVAIAGVITTREVMRHAGVIAREFGPRLLWRCAVAIALRRRTTFLALVCAP